MKNKEQKIKWLKELVKCIENSNDSLYLCNRIGEIIMRSLPVDPQYISLQKYVSEFFPEFLEELDNVKQLGLFNAKNKYVVWLPDEKTHRLEFLNYLLKQLSDEKD